MPSANILIVDDEIIIARELETRLTGLGYTVAGIAASGREAIHLAEQTAPDLVLMDIVLKGDMDGIEAATLLRQSRSVPIVYLTAYTDETTLRRARVTEPFGYIVKPFSERELRANIEMALYKHQVEDRLRKVERWFAASMERVADGVVATSPQGVITFLNREAEALTGWTSAEAVSQPMEKVLSLVSGSGNSLVAELLTRTLQERLFTRLGDETFLVNRAGQTVPIDLTAACTHDPQGLVVEVVVILRDLSERTRLE